MMQFNLSQSLVKPLARHITTGKALQPDLLWRADIAMIGNELCMVAHEQQSNYIMVLCGLDGGAFADFPELFSKRFASEAIAICLQSGLYSKDVLAKHLVALCKQQQYQPDLEPLEEGRISKAMEKLERRFLYDGLPLPIDGKSAFEFGVGINSKKNKTQMQNEQPGSLEMFGNLCLSLIAEAIELEQQAENPVIASHDNIVTVDFNRFRA